MTMQQERDIMELAERQYGMNTQVVVAIEELSELIKELTKYLRGNVSYSALTEEAADVSIVLDEVIMMFNIRAGVEACREEKLKRLVYRIEEDQRHSVGEVEP